ncbi:hypothetical protein ALC53_03393 [Atta colombica]|uniref:Uncharacterized protein n=1 Tax=Atta colombica TaxID=520822 RepID=A0A195BPS1_9HYME|nr:hypothetical protein ALC53_03393 [Atta colombica]
MPGTGRGREKVAEALHHGELKMMIGGKRAASVDGGAGGRRREDVEKAQHVKDKEDRTSAHIVKSIAGKTVRIIYGVGRHLHSAKDASAEMTHLRNILEEASCQQKIPKSPAAEGEKTREAEVAMPGQKVSCRNGVYEVTNVSSRPREARRGGRGEGDKRARPVYRARDHRCHGPRTDFPTTKQTCVSFHMIAICHVDCDEILLKPKHRFCRRGFIMAITSVSGVHVSRPVQPWLKAVILCISRDAIILYHYYK